MTTKEERVTGRVFRKHLTEPPGEAGHVLIVLEDWNPLLLLMGGNPLEALQHLVAGNAEPAGRGMAIRKDCAPD